MREGMEGTSGTDQRRSRIKEKQKRESDIKMEELIKAPPLKFHKCPDIFYSIFCEWIGQPLCWGRGWSDQKGTAPLYQLATDCITALRGFIIICRHEDLLLFLAIVDLQIVSYL